MSEAIMKEISPHEHNARLPCLKFRKYIRECPQLQTRVTPSLSCHGQTRVGLFKKKLMWALTIFGFYIFLDKTTTILLF
jgi:hypothetical protein